MNSLLNLIFLFCFSILAQERLDNEILSNKLSDIIEQGYKKISLEKYINDLILNLKTCEDKILFNKFKNYFSLKSKLIEQDKIFIRKYLYNRLFLIIELLKTSQIEKVLELLKNTKYLDLVNNIVKNSFEICIKLIDSKYNLSTDLSKIVLDYVDSTNFTSKLIFDAQGDFCYSPDGKYICSTSFADDFEEVSKITIFEADSGIILKILKGQYKFYCISCICWSPNGLYIAAILNMVEILIWSVNSGKLLSKFTAHDGSTLSIAWSPNSLKIASAGNDLKAKIWNVSFEKKSLEEKSKFQYFQYDSIVRCINWVDNNILAISTANGQVDVRYLNLNRSIFKFKKPEPQLWNEYFSLECANNKLAFNSKNLIRLFDTKTNELTTLIGHTDKIISIHFNTDSSKLVSCSEDKTIKIWDTCTGKMIEEIKTDRDVSDIKYSPCGRYIAYSDRHNITILGRTFDNYT